MKTLTILLIALSFECVAQAPTGKIYFLGRHGGYSAFIDKKIVCKVSYNKYSIHEVTPGRHQVDAQIGGAEYKGFEEQNPFFVEVEAGKSYYIDTDMVPNGLMKFQKLVCQDITENSANYHFKKMTGEDSNCFKK